MDKNGPKSGLSLLVVDLRKLTRDCLIAALEGSHEFDSVVAATSLDEATAQLTERDRFDATLVNFANDEFGDADLAKIKERLAELGAPDFIVLLTTHTDGIHVAAALRQGIRGFLSIDTPLDVTIDAIRLVSKGWLIYPPIDPALLVRAQNEGARRDFGPELTPRRRQVLQRLQQGMTNRDIARQLSVSERTIKAHVQELMRVLGASNRTQVVALTSGRRPSMDQSNDD